MIEDAELLRRYAEGHSEAAFAALVQRHVNLIYGAALRRVGGDRQLAEEVTQTVFTTLAAKAGPLARHPALVGWLHRSTRYAALNALREKMRQERRVQAVKIMNANPEPDGNQIPETSWDEIRPVLDSLLDQLGERDRGMLLLRFFENRTFAEIGAIAHLSEDAARMRVDRALGKLNSLLGRRGITSTAAALGVALANEATATAPAGVAASVTSSALASAAAGVKTGAILSLMSMNTVKIGVAAIAVVAATTLIVQQTTRVRPAPDATELSQPVPTSANPSPASATALPAGHEEVRPAAPLPEAPAPMPTATAAPAQAKALAKGLKPASALTNAGNATPASAAETLRWAHNGGDTKLIGGMTILSGKAQALAAQGFANLPPDKRTQYGTPEGMLAELMGGTTETAGFQVMSSRSGAIGPGLDPALATDPGYQTLHTQVQYPDGRVREGDQIFQQTPDGWKQVLQEGAVLKLLVETGLLPLPKRKSGGG